MAALTYAQSGVDRDKADELVNRISTLAKMTYGKHRTKLKASIGGYASLYEINKKQCLAASTDGVGTKLKLAFQLNIHNTIGIDLVAMSVNDLLCVGAEPLFFLDYFATGKLHSGTADEVLKGIVEGCKHAGCALVGGETAEMPEFYQEGEYDLGGFAVGMVDSKGILPKKTVKPGDVLIGIASSGCHSNGFSLLRKLIPEGDSGHEVAALLLTPTKIYVNSLRPLIQKKKLKGMAHITGSGFLNVPRMSDKVNYRIVMPEEKEIAPIFKWLRSASGLPPSELLTTFNMGIGMVLAVEKKNAAVVLRMLRQRGEKAWSIGEVCKRDKGQKAASHVVIQDSSGEYVTLQY